MNLPLTRRSLSLTVVATLFFLLAGCGGGGGGGGGNTNVSSDTVAPSAVGKAVRVVPALGAFSEGALVKAFKPDGTQIGTTVQTDSFGSATVDFGDYNGSFILKVTGGTGVTYFNEKTGSASDFDLNASLFAAVPATTVTAGEAFGVTPLTNLAAALAGVDTSAASPTLAGDAKSAMDKAVTRVQLMLGIGPDTFDILQAPSPIKSASSKVSASNSAGLYGVYLAELAKASSSNPLAQATLFLQKGQAFKAGTTSDLTTDLVVLGSAFTNLASSSFVAPSSLPTISRTPNFTPSDADITTKQTEFATTRVQVAATKDVVKTTGKTITVVPAVGLVGEGATVSVIDPTGLITTINATTGVDGTATVAIGNFNGPMILRVKGGTYATTVNSTATTRDVVFTSFKNSSSAVTWGDTSLSANDEIYAVIPSTTISNGARYGVSLFTHVAATFAGVKPGNLVATKAQMEEGLARSRLFFGIGSDTVLLNAYTLNMAVAPALLSREPSPLLETSTANRIDVTAEGGYMGLYEAELFSQAARTFSDAMSFTKAAAGLAYDLSAASFSDAAVASAQNTLVVQYIKAAAARMASSSLKSSACVSNSDQRSKLNAVFSNVNTNLNLAPSTTVLNSAINNVKQGLSTQSAATDVGLTSTTCN